MGIDNIHILTDPEEDFSAKVSMLVQQKLIADHRRGDHTYGNMRRDCPLCQRA